MSKAGGKIPGERPGQPMCLCLVPLNFATNLDISQSLSKQLGPLVEPDLAISDWSIQILDTIEPVHGTLNKLRSTLLTERRCGPSVLHVTQMDSFNLIVISAAVSVVKAAEGAGEGGAGRHGGSEDGRTCRGRRRRRIEIKIVSGGAGGI